MKQKLLVFLIIAAVAALGYAMSHMSRIETTGNSQYDLHLGH